MAGAMVATAAPMSAEDPVDPARFASAPALGINGASATDDVSTGGVVASGRLTTQATATPTRARVPMSPMTRRGHGVERWADQRVDARRGTPRLAYGRRSGIQECEL